MPEADTDAAIGWLDALARTLAEEDRKHSATRTEQAPDFNAFEHFAPDENRLSYIIAQLINPLGSHAQGSLFLDAFLKLAPEGPQESRKKASAPGETPWARPTGAVTSVSLESRTHNIAASNRRLDVRVDFTDGVVAIENKPWAGEQTLQVGDYLDELETCRRQFEVSSAAVCCLYYLTTDGAQPVSCRNQEQRSAALDNGTLRPVSYAQLAQAWEAAAAPDRCRSPRVSSFVKEFVAYINRNLGGRMQQQDETLIAYATQDAPSVRTALRTAYAESAIKRRLAARFLGQLESRFAAGPLPAQGWKLRFVHELDGQIQCGAWVARHADAPCRLRYIFDTSGYGSLAFGIERSSRNGACPDLKDWEVLNNQALTGGQMVRKNDKEWPWWINLPEPYFDWRRSLEPWEGIASDDARLADQWIGRFETAVRLLGEGPLLAYFDVVVASAGTGQAVSA